jgi:hypothetical protein
MFFSEYHFGKPPCVVGRRVKKKERAEEGESRRRREQKKERAEEGESRRRREQKTEVLYPPSHHRRAGNTMLPDLRAFKYIRRISRAESTAHTYRQRSSVLEMQRRRTSSTHPPIPLPFRAILDTLQAEERPGTAHRGPRWRILVVAQSERHTRCPLAFCVFGSRGKKANIDYGPILFQVSLGVFDQGRGGGDHVQRRDQFGS